MDYKLKRLTVALAVFTGLAVIAIVVAANWSGTPKKNPETVSTVEAVNNAPQEKSLQIGNNLSAWQSDEGFFDNSENTLTRQIMEDMLTLSVSAVSVERDVRVCIKDYHGELRTGESFEVALTRSNTSKTGEIRLTDDDCDGVLYADDLEPGSYTVRLMPLNDYIVPDIPLSITVKNTVDTAKIEDIGVLLKEKSEAETSIDDLMILSADSYADKKQTTSFGKDNDVIYGIDCSAHNGEIDWKKVYDSGIRFVMLRAGYRGAVSGDIVIDKSFETNAKNALRSGLDVGAYFFSQAVDVKEAVEEASALLEITDEVNLTYPLAVRIDLAGGLGRADGLDSDTRTEIVEAFCKTLKSEGADPCIYACSNWLRTNIDSKKAEKYKVWMADFTRETSFNDCYYDIWQYSSKGSVSGVEGYVSLNISYIE